MRVFKLMPMLSVLLLAVGCASPRSQYYTLLPEAAPARAASSGSIPPAYVISVQAVSIPAQVNRPQIVIGTPDSVVLTPLNNSLWAAPLDSEIRQALAYDLARRLGVLEVPVGVALKKMPLWKIDIVVHRFDSIYRQGVVVDASWRLTPVNQPKQAAMICQAQINVPAGAGIAALVQSHQIALQDLASVMAAQLSHQPISSNTAVRLKGCT